MTVISDRWLDYLSLVIQVRAMQRRHGSRPFDPVHRPAIASAEAQLDVMTARLLNDLDVEVTYEDEVEPVIVEGKGGEA